MAALEAFVLDGTVTLVAIGVLALELAVLLATSKSRGSNRTAGLVCNVLSGLFLILALRGALLEYGAMAVAAFLGMSLLAHAADMAMRLRAD